MLDIELVSDKAAPTREDPEGCREFWRGPESLFVNGGGGLSSTESPPPHDELRPDCWASLRETKDLYDKRDYGTFAVNPHTSWMNLIVDNIDGVRFAYSFVTALDSETGAGKIRLQGELDDWLPSLLQRMLGRFSCRLRGYSNDRGHSQFPSRKAFL